jgi:hypothetical protein
MNEDVWPFTSVRRAGFMVYPFGLLIPVGFDSREYRDIPSLSTIGIPTKAHDRSSQFSAYLSDRDIKAGGTPTSHVSRRLLDKLRIAKRS